MMVWVHAAVSCRRCSDIVENGQKDGWLSLEGVDHAITYPHRSVWISYVTQSLIFKLLG